MRFGLWAPLPHTIRPEPIITQALEELGTKGVGRPVDRSFQFVLEAVHRAEELGFHTTLVAERFVARDLEAWIVAAALAAHTSKIEILTAVHPGIVTPQVVAKMGASLDRLSGGRFAVNIVPGRRADEFELFGNGAWLTDSEQRYRRMDEFIQVMKRLWTEDSVDLDGQFYKVHNGHLATKTVRTPCPPIYAASGSEAGMEIVARECDTWFVSHEPGLAAYEGNVRKIAADIENMRRRSAAHGRTLGYGISTYVICTETSEAAEAEARSLDAVPEANVAAKALGAGLVGTPDVIAERIRRYQDCGIDCLMLQFHPMMDGLETFAQRVMPLLR
jgi:FMNH2-dependent dimethyl sulfone monooxygenase